MPGGDAEQRRDLVLRDMLEQHMITRAAYTDATHQVIPTQREINPPQPDSTQPYFSTWVAQQLVDHYGPGATFGGGLQITTTLDPKMQTAAQQAIQAHLGGVGPTVAKGVHDYFQLPASRALIARLLQAGIVIRQPERQEGPLTGKTFVLTGSLSSLTRGQAEERIKSLGGAIGSNVTKKTDYLVVGADPGSKLEKAQRLKVPVLDEAAFLVLLG